MLQFAINHMTVPQVTLSGLLDMAQNLNCIGVELRNDLDRPLFDDAAPVEAKAQISAKRLRLLGLAELKAFNLKTGDKLEEAAQLIRTARAAGAEGVALIPAVGVHPVGRDEQRQALRDALRLLQPILEKYDISGLIEPLGFAASSLRYKADVATVLAEMGHPPCFGVVHDTFHHHLADEQALFADLTAVVHVSGVTDPDVSVADMTDAHRALVDADDRLCNLEQLRTLYAAGYRGPVSFEAFATEIHDLTDPAAALAGSIAFITDGLADLTAGAA